MGRRFLAFALVPGLALRERGRCILGEAHVLGRPPDSGGRGGRADGRARRRLVSSERSADRAGARGSGVRTQAAARTGSDRSSAGPPDCQPPDRPRRSTTTTTTTTTDDNHDADRHVTDRDEPGSTPAPATPKQVANPDLPVTMAQLDLRLVQSLSLGKAANEFTAGARAAGLKVRSRFGTEVVARLLGLRINHPASEDSLELRPTDPATRAEAAYSAAQMLQLQSRDVAAVQTLADTFVLPAFTDWQRQILDDRVRAGRDAVHLGRYERRLPRPSSASRRGAATTAPASSGGSTSSRPTPARGHSLRCSAAGRRFR